MDHLSIPVLGEGAPGRAFSRVSQSVSWSLIPFDPRALGKIIVEERRCTPEEIGVVDILPYLEGAAYVGFIAGATFAVLELRTMSRDRKIELMLRQTEFFCSRDFEEATVNAVKGNFEPGKISDVDMKMLADYWDSMAEMMRMKLVSSDVVNLNYESVWEWMRPWLATWEERVGEGRFENFEWMAHQQCKERLAAEQKAKAA